jgi:hypothetical protein
MLHLPGIWYRIYFGPTGECYQIILEIEELDDSYLNAFLFEMTVPTETDGNVYKMRIADPNSMDSYGLCSDGMYNLVGTSMPATGIFLPLNDGYSTMAVSAPIPVEHPDHWVDPDRIGWSFLSVYFTRIHANSVNQRWTDTCPACAEAAEGELPYPPAGVEYAAAYPAVFMLPNPGDAGAKKMSKRKIKVRWKKDK